MPILGAIDGSGDSPGTPVMGTATAGNTRAVITFTPPSYIGKGSISYTAVSSPGGFTGSSAGSPIEVAGLTNGTSYTFTIYGMTDYGIQTATTAASNAVTPFAPPVYPPYGTLIAANQCSGTTLYNLRADGTGGTYNEILEVNSTQCGYTPPPPVCTAAGTLLAANQCSGYNLYNLYADGSCGSYAVITEYNSGTCGYVPPIPYCSSCTGSLNRTEIIGGFCSSGCRYLTRRYYWNAPLCQPDPCQVCTCPPYDDNNELLCCACFGCY